MPKALNTPPSPPPAAAAAAQGKHTLTLQFANANHQSYGPEYANTISVNIK
jgi:hypothetical protein